MSEKVENRPTGNLPAVSVKTTTEVLVMPKVAYEERIEPTRFERLTDRVVNALSTPSALVVQSALVAGYVAINALTLTKAIAFDPYPFLFLNLVFSVISGFTTVFVLNSNRRQDQERAAQTAEIKSMLKELLERQDDKKNTRS